MLSMNVKWQMLMTLNHVASEELVGRNGLQRIKFDSDYVLSLGGIKLPRPSLLPWFLIMWLGHLPRPSELQVVVSYIARLVKKTVLRHGVVV